VTTRSRQEIWQKVGTGVVQGSPRTGGLVALILAVLWLMPGCPTPPGGQDLKKDMEALKTEMAAIKEKLSQVEASQKVLLEMVKGNQKAQAAAPAGTVAGLPVFPAPAAPAPGTPLTVDELFKQKDQMLGTRVTVKGLPGPVMMHKKTLFLGGPGGMVEVIYGNLQDKKQVERLTAQNIETPLTVSGILSAAPGQTKEPVRLIIMADMVEF
jgi:hypothetical protein